jgi:hypothetical protein
MRIIHLIVGVILLTSTLITAKSKAAKKKVKRQVSHPSLSVVEFDPSLYER